MCIVAQKSQWKIPILGDGGTNPAKVTSFALARGCIRQRSVLMQISRSALEYRCSEVCHNYPQSADNMTVLVPAGGRHFYFFGVELPLVRDRPLSTNHVVQFDKV
jgi:hypothetical protein